MNSLHMLLVALLLHRAVVWHADRRHRDLVIGALLAGLCVSNHGLAITVVPIVVLFVLWDARREIIAAPAGAGRVRRTRSRSACFPTSICRSAPWPDRPTCTARFLTWNGFFAHVSGAQFRSDMKFGTLDSVRARHRGDAAGHRPRRVGLECRLRRPWRPRGRRCSCDATAGSGCDAGHPRRHQRLHLCQLPRRPVSLPAAHLADPDDRAGARRGAVVDGRRERDGPPGGRPPVRDPHPAGRSSSRRTGRPTTSRTTTMASDSRRKVFAALPPNAVLVTYWDALTTLSYEHCIEGVRPDVTLRAYDEFALVTCDPIPRPLTEIVKKRPVYALMMFPKDLRGQTGLDAGPDRGQGPSPVRQALSRSTRRSSTSWSRPARLREMAADYALLDIGGAGAARTVRHARHRSTAPGRARGASRSLGLADRRPALRPRRRLERRRRGADRHGRSSWTGCAWSFDRPRRARSGSSPSTWRCCRGCATRWRRGPDVGRGAGRPAPVRVHRPGHARDGRRGWGDHPPGRLSPDAWPGRAGTPSCPGWPIGPLRWIVDDAARVHRARGPT